MFELPTKTINYFLPYWMTYVSHAIFGYAAKKLNAFKAIRLMKKYPFTSEINNTFTNIHGRTSQKIWV